MGRSAQRMTLVRAFTLIELLVVIALTSILFTLIFIPLTDSINLTSRAGTQIESQGAARDVMRQLEAEVSSPVYVYDNAQMGLDTVDSKGNKIGALGSADGRVNLWLYRNTTNTLVAEMIRYGMIEFIEPGSQSEQSGTSTLYDPTTGKNLPPAGVTNVGLPLAPGRTIVRYFPGLVDNTSQAATFTDDYGHTFDSQPVKPYANEYEDAQQDVTARLANRTTLYRAEVQPYIPDPNNPGAYIPNTALFHTIKSGAKSGNSTTQSDTTGTLLLDDPNFFYDVTPVPAAIALAGAPGVAINGRATVPMWECWKSIAQSMLSTAKADAIALERDPQNKIVLRNAKGQQATDIVTPAPVGPYNPVLRPLISFTPQYVENDAAIPSSLANSGAETPYAAATQFRSQYPAWSRPFRVLVYRSADGLKDPLSTVNPTYYEMDDPSLLSGITLQGVGGDVGPRPDTSGNWMNIKPQFAFTVDYDRGAVNFAFSHGVLDHDANGNTVPMSYNPSTINDNIDNSGYGTRYLWLRYFDAFNLNKGVNAVSPLDQFNVPLDAPGTAVPTPYNVRIVPGSERVYGPDQLPGLHYGYRTQYTRVSSNSGVVGANQYRILYENAVNANTAADAKDPRVQTGYIEFDSRPDADPDFNKKSANLDPNLENPAPSNVNPPVYRVHGLPQLKYDQNTSTNVQADEVEVSYSFQMNRPTDVVKIDYLTRSIMNVSMELRLYDPRSARPQTTQLASKIAVRNIQR